MASSCESGSVAAGSGGSVSGFDTPEVTPDEVGDVADVGDVEGDGVPEEDDGLPGWPAFSGLFSLITVRQAPFTRTNEYALIIR